MAQVKTVKLNIDAEEALKRLDAVEKQLEGINKSSKKTAQGTNMLAKGFTGIGLAWKAIGIGAVIGALQFLAEKFSANQKILDSFNIGMAVFGDVLTQIGTVVISVVKGLGLLGKAVGKVLKGEFKEAGDLAKQSFDGVKESIVGNNESFSDFIKNAKTAAKETANFAKTLITTRNEVKLAEAEQRKLQLTYQKDAELQRQLRDDISLTFEERIAANDELGRILDEQFKEEQSLAEKKVALAELELSRNKDNIDLQVALINAETELADLEERITGQRSEQLTNEKALEKERNDAIQANIDLKRKEGQELAQIYFQQAKEEIEAKEKQIATVKAMEIQGAQSILSSLGQLAGEGTQLAKATALANILINSAQGVSAAIKAGAGLPFPANLGAIATGVGAVLSGIVSAKSIFKKAKSPIGGGGLGGDEIDSGIRVSASSAGIGGESLIPNLEGITTEAIGETPPVQAFVVENDISNAQALQQELDVQATL